jgi:diaminohydroxyphosphoribosylaminopyrimidine deaminase/5-amino-6-(5-phosphoribosylamino)uracil reductase
MMRRALVDADKGWGQTAPNPLVGAVIVSPTGDIIADGAHEAFGQPHAEVMALRAAKGHTRGATLYVTLEPCTHQGKTPPCVDAIVEAGIARVVVATRDPNPVAGGGVEFLRSKGITVDVGVEHEAACELNAPFFNSFASDRPWVTLKMALSADGAIADPTGQRRYITNEESRDEVHYMRAGSDAIAVGVGTIVADDPELTVRRASGKGRRSHEAHLPRRLLIRVIFDSQLRVPLRSMVVETAWRTPTIVVASRPEPNARQPLFDRGVEIVDAPDLAAALRALRSRGIHSLLLEGGATLAGSFLRERLVDRIAIFRSPVTLGAGALKAFAHAPPETESWLASLPIVGRRTFGDDTLTTYAVREVPCSRE